MEVEYVFSLVYIFFCVIFVVPPQEFVSAGFTIQNVFDSYLGSETHNFILYHIKRSTLTLLIHSLLPIGHYIGLGIVAPHLHLLYPWDLRCSILWNLWLLITVIVFLFIVILVHYYTKRNYFSHPIPRQLAKHASNGSSWKTVASDINIEFRRIDKFLTGPLRKRIIVTDSWLMQTSTYSVRIAHHSDIILTVVSADAYEFSHESSTGIQYLNIRVTSVTNNFSPFLIRLLSSDYRDLKSKFTNPIVNAKNVMIQQSLNDRFIEAFREVVRINPKYKVPQETEIETCIGCMQKNADVKLQKYCTDLDEGDCKNCYCRPMWCLECMARWFSNRQDQQKPEIWMKQNCPCPTCRSTFCVLDVCMI